jgi:hypothetical protein
VASILSVCGEDIPTPTRREGARVCNSNLPHTKVEML